MKHPIFLVIAIILVLLGVLFIWNFQRYTLPVPPPADNNVFLLHKGSNVISFQISEDSKNVIFVTNENSVPEVYKWNIESKTITKLINNGTNTDIKIPTALFFARSFVDTENNMYFDIGTNLIKVHNNENYKIYKFIDDYELDHGGNEIDRERSLMYKQLSQKYSKTPPVGYKVKFNDDNEITYHLFEINNDYYIPSPAKSLTFHRLPLATESDNSLLANSYTKLDYLPKWDGTQNRMNEKGKIRMVHETLLETTMLPLKTPSTYTEVNIKLDGNYPIKNDDFSADLYFKCYPIFMPIDGPRCKATKLFLKRDGSMTLISNGKLYDDSETHEDFKIYLPSDKRFFMNNGDFIFLSQDFKLYKY